MSTIFKKSIELNSKIEDFLGVIDQGLLLFEKSISVYLDGDRVAFKETLDRINDLETEADTLENDIKTSLYKFLLLPDVRADVLSLIKSLDNIIDALEEITKDFYIQKPAFPEGLHGDVKALCHQTILSADALLKATSAFFNELHLVASYVGKVNFYEHEADIVEDRLSDYIFNGDTVSDLAHKMHLNQFIDKIAKVADEAENIGAKLSIFSIKREI